MYNISFDFVLYIYKSYDCGMNDAEKSIKQLDYIY